MTKSTFPTFEQIEEGHTVFATSFYKGKDDYGEAVYGEKLALDVIISHNRYFPLIKSVKIMRNRNKTKRLYFAVRMYDNIEYKFPYSEEGWSKAILYIKDCARTIRQACENILNEK